MWKVTPEGEHVRGLALSEPTPWLSDREWGPDLNDGNAIGGYEFNMCHNFGPCCSTWGSSSQAQI